MAPVAVKLEDLPAWRANVLVAVSDPALRGELERTLRADGHHVRCVDDGVALLEALSESGAAREVHVAIADVQLDGFSGVEVLGMTDGVTGRPPLVLLAEEVDPAIQRAAKRFGAACVLARPFDMDELRFVVGSLLRPTYRAAMLHAA